MARSFRSFVVAALALLVTSAAAAETLTPRVRVLDACAGLVVEAARRQSATVRELETRLGQSDVVAYVRCFWPNGKEPDAYLSWVSATPSFRYVLISLTRQLSPWRRIEMLGHEMQHALEVAEAEWVQCDADLEALFGEIGRRTQVTRACFETAAAQAVEWAVRRDLSETPADARPAAEVVADHRQKPQALPGSQTALAAARPRGRRR